MVDVSSSRSPAGHQFPSVTRPPEPESIEVAAHQLLGVDDAVDLDVLEDAGLASEADVLAEFQEPGTPRRRSARRRRSSASSSRDGVSDFTLDTPKAS
jgi:hypothetical protein